MPLGVIDEDEGYKHEEGWIEKHAMPITWAILFLCFCFVVAFFILYGN